MQHAGEARSEQVWLVRLGWAPLWGCVATGGVRDLQAWPLVSDVLVPAVLSCEEHCSEVQCLLHEVQGCRPSVTCAATNRRPLPSHCCSGRRWRGKRTHSVDAIRGKTGVDSTASDATLQNVGEIESRLQNGIVHKPNDAICEVTGRRHRVSPCRSAY